MKTRHMRLFITALGFIILGHAVVWAAERSQITLVDVLDAPKIVGIALPARPFVESAFAIQQILAAHVVTIEKPGVISLAENLRVVLATLREGHHVVTKDPMSIRSYLQEFATKWNVVILITDDTIMIVESWDKDRFQHRIAIMPKKLEENKEM